MTALVSMLVLAVVVHTACGLPAHAAPRPNIVLVITDDQGYGDLGCTGNPIVRTPHLDRLAGESTSLTDFHVAPTCSPTRAALLTGHWTDRTGVWHTVNGRSMLRENEITLGQMLKDAGYATGMFGKWHLGDNYPYRAEDRGFTEVYRHGGGGVGQTPDIWDNSYFDGHYFHNGEIVAAEGFCTDVFFQQAQRFIRECAARQQPFLAYIAPNAPHGPLHCPQNYLDMYSGQPADIAAFYGMITNIDDNVGATRALLKSLNLEHNTLFVFMTDNGTATGSRIFNAGMRGAKGSEYEGGHRVPFIAHWPAAGWNRPHTDNTLCHAVDVVPTLLELTGTPAPMDWKPDGKSLRVLLDPAVAVSDWPERILVTDSQRVRDPIKWKQTAVMSGRWRLVNNRELYDIHADPGQRQNLIAQHPERAADMRAFYDAWWAELEPTFAQTTEILLGHPAAPVVTLTGHDWIQEDLPPWNQAQIRTAQGYLPPRVVDKMGQTRVNRVQPLTHTGHWAVRVWTPGQYTVSLRRWPLEANTAIVAGIPEGKNVPGRDLAFRARHGMPLPIQQAVLRIDDRDVETKPLTEAAASIEFHVTLSAGSHRLAPYFTTDFGDQIGAYYTIVTPARPAP